MFSAPSWLRDLGFASWLLVGFVLVIVGLVWLLGQTSTIVMPVILATFTALRVVPRAADQNVRSSSLCQRSVRAGFAQC